MDILIDILTYLPRGLIYVALGLVVLILAKLARDVVTRHGIEEEIVTKGNLAVALRLSGYLMGVILVFLGAVYEPLGGDGYIGLGLDRAFGLEVLWVFLYSLAGIVALNLMRLVTDRLVLYRFELEREILQDQKCGSGGSGVWRERRLRPRHRRSNRWRGWTAQRPGVLRPGPGRPDPVRPVLRMDYPLQHPRRD